MGKRHTGIYQRKDGRYTKDVYIDGKRKSVYGASKQEVAEKIRALEAQHAQGVDIAAKRITVEAFLLRWLSEVVIHRKYSTHKGYAQIARDHLIPHIGHLPITELRPDHVQAMVNTLTKSHAPRTVRNIRACLRRALNQAMRWRLVAYNAAALVEIPRAPKYLATTLTYEQARALLTVARGTVYEVVYRLTLELGLRMGEVLGLLRSDVQLDAGYLTLTGTLHVQARTLVREKYTKADDTPQRLPISPALARLLAWQLDSSGTTLYLFGSGAQPMSPDKLTWHYRKHLKQAGCPHIRFHDLRHSCATFLIQEGEHPRMVMEHMRHSTITITMDIYGHIFPDEHQRAGRAISEKLDTPPSISPSNDATAEDVPD